MRSDLIIRMVRYRKPQTDVLEAGNIDADRARSGAIEAGDHKDRVIHILSKVKGLDMASADRDSTRLCLQPMSRDILLKNFKDFGTGRGDGHQSEDVLFSAEDLPVVSRRRRWAANSG